MRHSYRINGRRVLTVYFEVHPQKYSIGINTGNLYDIEDLLFDTEEEAITAANVFIVEARFGLHGPEVLDE